MGDFCSKYSKSRSNTDCGQEPKTKKTFNRQQENNATVQHEVNEIILQYSIKLSAEAEENEIIYSVIDENNQCNIDIVSLDYKK